MKIRERFTRWIVKKLMPGYVVQSKKELHETTKLIVKLRLEKEGIII